MGILRRAGLPPHVGAAGPSCSMMLSSSTSAGSKGVEDDAGAELAIGARRAARSGSKGNGVSLAEPPQPASTIPIAKRTLLTGTALPCRGEPEQAAGAAAGTTRDSQCAPPDLD